MTPEERAIRERTPETAIVGGVYRGVGPRAAELCASTKFGGRWRVSHLSVSENHLDSWGMPFVYGYVVVRISGCTYGEEEAGQETHEHHEPS